MDNAFTPSIGKDVIESLTLGMYEDPRFIYREYIQNCADQIDKAVRDGLIEKGQGEIHIHIDPEKRRIEIEDNATGIQKDLVLPVLQNIAQSTKQRGVDKGFRGIGRLGGLAYCKRLVFVTSFYGEPIKSILTWNAEKLKLILNNRGEREEAARVIQEVTSSVLEKDEPSSHYFKVILEGVSNDDLLQKEKVEEYLSMVAPLPFGTKFIFRSKIYEELQTEKLLLDEYKIYLNTELLYKGYSTFIKKDESQAPHDQIIDVVFFKAYASDGVLLFWGWHSVSEKNQSIPSVNFTRGFRLRKSNIQVGDEFTLLKHHRDRRFQFYFFGEVYGTHPDLIPNSRRDYFTDNAILNEFEQKLQAHFHGPIHKLCFTAADINTFLRKNEELRNIEIEYKQKNEAGFTDKNEQKEYREKFDRKKEETIKARKKIERIERDLNEVDSQPVKTILQRVIQPSTKTDIETIEIPTVEDRPKYRTDKLSNLNKQERKFLGRIFTIIREVLDANTAENLIQKIEEELK